jgi:hypothetical protein
VNVDKNIIKHMYGNEMLPVHVQLESRKLFWSILTGTQREQSIIPSANASGPTMEFDACCITDGIWFNKMEPL